MAILFTDGVGLYGTGAAASVETRVLEKWDSSNAAAAIALVTPGRHASGTPNLALGLYNGTYLEKNIPAASPVIVGMGFKLGTVVLGSLIEYWNGSTKIGSLSVDTGGKVQTRNSSGAEIGGQSPGVVVDTNWSYIEAKFTAGNAGEGAMVVRKNAIVVWTTTGLSWGTALSPDRIRIYGQGAGVSNFQFQDIVVGDTSGTQNNDFLGEVRVETLFPTDQGFNRSWVRSPVNSLSDNQASLETDVAGWVLITPANGTVTKSTEQALYGIASMKCTGSQASANEVAAIAPTGTAGIPVVAGETFSMRADLKQVLGTLRDFKLRVRWYDSGGTFISDTDSTQATGTTAWVTRSFSGTVPANAAFAAPVVMCTNAVTGVSWHWDGIQFVRGAIVTTFIASRHHAVNEVPHDSAASYVESDVIGAMETFDHTDLSTAQGSVLAVRSQLVIARTISGPRTIGGVGRAAPGTITAAPSVVAVSSNSGNPQVIVARPAGAQKGDLLVAAAGVADSGSTITCAGWTTQLTQGTSFKSSAFMYRVVGPLYNEATSYTFTHNTGSDNIIVTIVCLRSVAASPINAAVVASMAGPTLTAGPVTTTVPYCRIFTVFVANNITTPPTGYTLHNNTGNNPSHMISSKEQEAAGSTGTATVSGAGTDQHPAYMVAIAPAVVYSDFTTAATASPSDTLNEYKIRGGPEFAINPATGNPWTIAEVNAAEFGIKIVT